MPSWHPFLFESINEINNAFVADKLIQAMGKAGKISIKQALCNLCGLHIED